MRISLTITNFSWPGGPAGLADRLGRIARQADEGGLDTLWVSDHLLQGGRVPTPPRRCSRRTPPSAT
jgi:alkanesulfonate monooxygenase SsuD/methylene tetrahydromethanopterin reductase-like flavin-dependent oxidoreductase (luciferase family)